MTGSVAIWNESMQEFAATKACELLAIDSPSGYTQEGG